MLSADTHMGSMSFTSVSVISDWETISGFCLQIAACSKMTTPLLYALCLH